MVFDGFLIWKTRVFDSKLSHNMEPRVFGDEANTNSNGDYLVSKKSESC
jgi:hypothetical protein